LSPIGTPVANSIVLPISAFFGRMIGRKRYFVICIGAATACAWLLYTRKPVVDVRVLKDRNFLLGSLAIACFSTLLYGSAVIIPQLAQQHLGYTALLAGLLLSPGAFCVILLIPLSQRCGLGGHLVVDGIDHVADPGPHVLSYERRRTPPAHRGSRASKSPPPSGGASFTTQSSTS
jgi:hypothetical protein